jgi:hypothetical protein
MLIKIIFRLFLITSSTAFADQSSYWLNDSAVCEINESNRQIKYNKEGHLNTTYIVARIAGHDIGYARQLACFSQMPDKEVMRLSAPAVAVWGIFSWEYRHLIMAILHSLHGGKGEEVQARRDKLAMIIKEGVANNQDSWKLGFMIHAMGDSYAHVCGNGENIKSYGELVGHAFAFSEKPDEISHEDNISHYTLYIKELFLALQKSEANVAKLEDFIDKVEKAAKSGNEEEVRKAIVHYDIDKTNTASNINADTNFTFSSDDEKEFLRSLRFQLEEQN